MAITERSYVERALVALNPDGSFKGAHVERIVEYVAESGDVIAAKQLGAEPIEIGALNGVLPEKAALMAELLSVRAALDAAESDLRAVRSAISVDGGSL